MAKIDKFRIGTDIDGDGKIYIYRPKPYDITDYRERKEAGEDAICAVIRHLLYHDPECKGFFEMDMNGETFGLVVIRKGSIVDKENENAST